MKREREAERRGRERRRKGGSFGDNFSQLLENEFRQFSLSIHDICFLNITLKMLKCIILL